MQAPIAPLTALALSLACALPACRATGKMLGNEYAEPQAALKWIARPELDQPSSDQPTVFIRPFKDAVGSGLDLTQQVKQAVEAAGYTPTSSRSADYQLVATLRHFDKAKTFDGGEGAMKTVQNLAPLVGAGLGVYAGSEAGAGGMIAGGILGGAAGVMGSAAMENFSKVHEWDLILDIELGERIAGGFEQKRTRSDAADSASGPQAGSEQGSRKTEDRREAEITQTKEYLSSTFRLVAVAYQMTMEREEALAVLLPRLPSAIQSVLP